MWKCACWTLICILCVARLSPGLWWCRRVGRRVDFWWIQWVWSHPDTPWNTGGSFPAGMFSLCVCVCVFSCMQWLKGTHIGESQPLSQDQTLQVGSEVFQQAWCFIRTVLLCHVKHWYSYVDKTHRCHSNFYIIFVQDVFKRVWFFALCFIILAILSFVLQPFYNIMLQVSKHRLHDIQLFSHTNRVTKSEHTTNKCVILNRNLAL